ncbi:type II secretion system F family protein [Dietzia aurantiaca]|uniref:type II secretion system F family protein n=1 Tax=Dietzia aurantiaca TaxID=983873 RepID=UPI001E4155CA|nr:type II secretion system F family protein [Dietzia aurantiaca]MCD2262771.1 type II secretion system F family protein [Dietzia aurantiaca]
MTLAFLLLATAVCVAPWRGAAVGRLDRLHPPAGRRGAPSVDHRAGDRPGRGEEAPGGDPGSALRRALLRLPAARFLRGRAGPDPDVLAQVVDLLRAALTAGLPAPDALAAVADAVADSRPDLASPLRTAGARLRLGATPEEAWHDVPGVEHLAPLKAVLVRATDGGGSVKAALEHTAVRMRAEADAAATARAERASVLVAGPLGLCFLPAFVCLGVLPVVVGLADGMLPGIGI